MLRYISVLLVFQCIYHLPVNNKDKHCISTRINRVSVGCVLCACIEELILKQHRILDVVWTIPFQLGLVEAAWDYPRFLIAITLTNIAFRYIHRSRTVTLALGHLRLYSNKEVVVAVFSLFPLESFLRKRCGDKTIITFLNRHLLELIQPDVKESEVVSAH